MTTSNYSKIYRVMHWLIAFSMMALLVTIFLRMTWMNKNHVADIIQDYLSTTNQTLTDDQAIQLAKKIRQPMWIWHIYIGYFLVALFTIRMTLPFFGEMNWQNPLKKGLSQKQRFQFWVYIVFYFCVIGSLISGLVVEFGPKDMKESAESIHEMSIYYLLCYIVLHFGGVVLAEMTSEKGLISRIISGNK